MEDKQFMARALYLAQLGKSMVSPNPQVGCVITHNHRIIGEGYHKKFGGAHAEIEALRSVKDKSLLSQATLYVSLEPCSHHGKTPPCSLAIQESGINKVVVGCKDPNPKVAGKGIAFLREHGIEVIQSSLEKECQSVNEDFFRRIMDERPYVILKWAKTKDGFMAKEDGESKWITELAARTHAHFLRANVDAILVGSGTVLRDNPSLTTRFVLGKNPVRIILDGEGQITPQAKNAQIRNQQAKTILYTSSRQEKDNEYIVQLPSSNPAQNLFFLMTDLYGRGVGRLMVEGGPKTIDGFIESNLWDEAWVYEGQKKFGAGFLAPSITGEETFSMRIGHDFLRIYKSNKLV